MADLFKEILPSILETKKPVYDLKSEIASSDYNAYIINRALCAHIDCVPYVNQMNINHSLDSNLQYQYLLNTIRPYKRKFQPWSKADKLDDLDCVKEYFGYSNEKAKEALRILTDEQIAFIKEKTEKGGVRKK